MYVHTYMYIIMLKIFVYLYICTYLIINRFIYCNVGNPFISCKYIIHINTTYFGIHPVLYDYINKFSNNNLDC